MTGSGSRLRRSTTVLVLVDVQERLASVMQHRETVEARIGLLVETASLTGCPIIVTRQYPKGLGDLVASVSTLLEQLEPSGTRIARVDKDSFDCFAEPEFVRAFDDIGRIQVLVAGMESHICVTQTALAALERGLDVHVAADACCSREAESHDLAVMRMCRAGVVITTAESAGYELVGRAGTPEFKTFLQLVKA